ncbi:MAG: type I 3-dehydroquinate dehydratase [Candidatus Delongbacteria bacterium]
MIFVSISEKNIDKCLKLIDKYKNVELRLDLIEPDIEELPLLISRAKTSICTFRTSDRHQKSLEYLKNAVEFGTDIVDFSLKKPHEYIFELSDKTGEYNKKLMLSYHNYDITPDKVYLEGLIKEAEIFEPDLIKIACNVNSNQESEMLLSLMEKSEHIIPVPMGKEGVKGRLQAYFYGVPVVYAYPDGEEPTAPGQLAFSEYKDMDRILSIINR